jgi:hypothetical protein
MALPIISAEQRLSEPRGIKGCIFGKSGIGKTSLLWTLPEKTTLFFDLEAGDLAIEGWRGNTMRPRTWEQCRDLAVLIGGADPAARDNQNYSQQHFDFVCQKFNTLSNELDAYETVFIDSLTVAARLCFGWCKRQSEVCNDKTNKPDLRRAYGLLGQEMLTWIIHLQHTRNKNIWFLGILDEKTDDFNRRYFEPQIEGTKTGLELPGIVDQVITMADIDGDIKDASGKAQSTKYRAFVCQTINPYGYPAKDRSGRLDCIESPDLGKLMTKLKTKGRPISQRLNYNCPDLQPQPQHLGE